MSKIPNAKIININFYYQNKPNENRSELAYVEGDDKYDQDSENDHKVGNLTIPDNKIFYYFEKDEEIIKNHGEFTVTSFEVVSFNLAESNENSMDRNSATMGFHNLSSEDWDSLSKEQKNILHEEASSASNNIDDIEDIALGHAIDQVVSEAPYHKKTNAEIMQMILKENDAVIITEEYEDLSGQELVDKINELKDVLMKFHQETNHKKSSPKF